MAKKSTKTTTKVKALYALARVGLAYFEGDEIEIGSDIAAELIKDGLAEKCGK